MSKKRIPIIALIGSANVGKSSLFNALAKQRLNIVAKEAGTTRDSIRQLVEFADQKYGWLVDTAGLKDPEDDFEMTIQDQVGEAIASADIILFLVDAQFNLTGQDRLLAKRALKSKKQVVLVVNKTDLNRKAKREDYLKLGIKDIFLISVLGRTGLGALKDHLVQSLATVSSEPGELSEDRLQVALVGRPNVGKSSLFNKIIDKQLAIVRAQAGTTRDLNRQVIRYHDQAIELIDTAGLRRSGKVGRGIEKFSVLRTVQAINQADICLLLLEADQLVVNLDQKIAGMIKEAYRGLIIVVNKWDIYPDKDDQSYLQAQQTINHYMPFVPWALVVFASSKTGRGIKQILDLVVKTSQLSQQEIKPAKLNVWLKQAQMKHPPAGLKNRRPKLKYISQTGSHPPTFMIQGRSTGYLHWSYKRFLERDFRHNFQFEGLAIKFVFKDSDS